MTRKSIPTYCFALVVVRLGHRFLLVQERKHGQLWYLPAGRVEPGETIVAAAHRETLEEAGVRVRLDGLLRIQHTPGSDSQRIRYIFSATPTDDTPPKSVADDESLAARWVTIAEMNELPLRGSEVLNWAQYVLNGGAVYPLTLLTDETAPP